MSDEQSKSNNPEWHEIAQKIFEDILKEADEDRDEIWEDVAPPPFFTLWPEPPAPEHAEYAHLLPEPPIILSYKIDGEEWSEDGNEMDSQGWEGELELRAYDLPQVIYKRCEDALQKFLTGNTATDKEGNRQTLAEILSPEVRAALLERFARDAITAIIHRLKDKLELALNEHWHESQLLAFARLTTGVAELMQDAGLEMMQNPNDEPLGQMKRLLTRAAARRRRSLKGIMAACLGAPYFDELEEHYKNVLPVWKDAKLIYKQNSNRSTWRGLIRAAHPDVEFDDDLLARLSGKLNDLPEGIQAKLSEKGGDSRPSSIALEHAARLCGAQPYQYSLRHLYNIKNVVKAAPAARGEESDTKEDSETMSNK